MKQHYFIGDWQLAVGRMRLVDHDFIHQVCRVLKLQAGEKILLGNGCGQKALATIEDLSHQGVRVKIESVEYCVNHARLVTLYCAILKKESFVWVVQKAVEVGVTHIVPLLTDQTIKADLNLVRMRKIMRESAEQSGRYQLATLSTPLKLSVACKQAIAETQDNFVCHTVGACLTVRALDNCKDRIGVWIGPEGGWNEQELALMRTAGFKFLSLGDTILRAETAAILGTWAAVTDSAGQV